MKALVVVDIQNDFLPNGALAVTNGDEIIPVVNELMLHFDLVVATQDWHPKHHESFASMHIKTGKISGDQIILHGLEQVLWPDHCIQNSFGSEFSKELDVNHFNRIFQKGTDPHVDSYSGFFDNGKKNNTGLHAYLVKNKVKEVFVVGLATDYCVKFTAIDSADLGFTTAVIADATKAVNLKKGEFDRSLDEMRSRNINIVHSNEILG